MAQPRDAGVHAGLVEARNDPHKSHCLRASRNAVKGEAGGVDTPVVVESNISLLGEEAVARWSRIGGHFKQACARSGEFGNIWPVATWRVS